MLPVGWIEFVKQLEMFYMYIGQKKSLRYYRPKNSSEHGRSINKDTVERFGQQKPSHLQDIHKGMIPCSESHPYEVPITHLKVHLKTTVVMKTFVIMRIVLSLVQI